MSESHDELMKRIVGELDRVLPSFGSVSMAFREHAYVRVFRFGGVEHIAFGDSLDAVHLQMAKICGIDLGDESDNT